MWLHTVFEGFTTNTYASGLAYLENDHGEVDPFYGYSAGTAGSPPEILQRYTSGGYLGTPFTVLVDRFGNILIEDFTTNLTGTQILLEVENALEE